VTFSHVGHEIRSCVPQTVENWLLDFGQMLTIFTLTNGPGGTR
jgi:hypothetical protein